MTAEPTDLIWAPLTDSGFPDVAELARRCLTRDGGMPAVTDEDFLRSRYTVPGAVALTVRHVDQRLVAAGAVRPGPAGAIATGMVDPQWRGAGVGARLLDRLLEVAERDGPATVETESLTPAVHRLFASRGLQQVFAEDIMRFDLTGAGAGPAAVPPTRWPDATTLAEWSDATANRFHAVYEAAFRDRPGFPGWSAREWISWAVDEDFRPEWSLLAAVPGVGDAGFIACGTGWIIQVGVVPAARGRGLGAALVAEALRRMRAAGADAALLDVNVDNPAGALYRRLGFHVVGRRARFRR